MSSEIVCYQCGSSSGTPPSYSPASRVAGLWKSAGGRRFPDAFFLCCNRRDPKRKQSAGRVSRFPLCAPRDAEGEGDTVALASLYELSSQPLNACAHPLSTLPLTTHLTLFHPSPLRPALRRFFSAVLRRPTENRSAVVGFLADPKTRASHPRRRPSHVTCPIPPPTASTLRPTPCPCRPSPRGRPTPLPPPPPPWPPGTSITEPMTLYPADP